MYHNEFRYDYLTFQTLIPLHKQYIFDTNTIQNEYVFLFPFSIVSKGIVFVTVLQSKHPLKSPTNLQYQNIRHNVSVIQTGQHFQI